MYSNFYEIPLPALCFEKVEETDTKSEKTTPKRTTPSKSTTSEERKNRQKNDKRRSAKKSKFHSQETTREGTQTLPELRNADRKRTSISAFKKWQPEQPRNRRRQPDQKHRI